MRWVISWRSPSHYWWYIHCTCAVNKLYIHCTYTIHVGLGTGSSPEVEKVMRWVISWRSPPHSADGLLGSILPQGEPVLLPELDAVVEAGGPVFDEGG